LPVQLIEEQLMKLDLKREPKHSHLPKKWCVARKLLLQLKRWGKAAQFANYYSSHENPS